MDAREICGGATGRNGGHINEVGFSDYRELRAHLGKEAAIKMLRFRLSHLNVLEKVAAEEGLQKESQIRCVRSATVFFDASAWEDVKHATNEFKGDLGEQAAEWRIVESSEELRV